ncbi:acetamidase/formamidase family protein [Phenylobacterium sp.]|uniref:acetamidase/formamidase family protein n=1 Tax=Phenylobacterium sp. TaxID=1871053 RepID=UPI00272F740A|nr:acetamidase/formamidase family protein [Phenylobacterium sp.]MDP1873377.1 acetamidase/formamidase family protein [Phenylobacterium sp.]
MIRHVSVAAALMALCGPAMAQPAAHDAYLRSTPETVLRGSISATRTPVLRITSGQTVRIDTVSHGGLTSDPVAYFAQAGITADEILQDVKDIAAASTGEGWRGHVLTGPIYVEGAEPGDMLEIRVVDLENRVPYGVNSPGTGGVVPGLLTEQVQKILKFDLERQVALFSPEIEVPLIPFLGIMAVAPDPAIGVVGSRAPGIFGGNMDLKRLTVGSTLYLPVFNPGALFYTGDAHAAQGDGEVSGNAIEASLTGTLQFIVHKGKGADMPAPFAEDAANYYVMGLDEDLDDAMRKSVENTVAFLEAHAGISKADAYSISSIAVDFAVAEAVDGVEIIYGTVPKKLFLKPAPYWTE